MRTVFAKVDPEGLIGFIVVVGWIVAQIAGAVKAVKARGRQEPSASSAPPESSTAMPTTASPTASPEDELKKFLKELERNLQGRAEPTVVHTAPPPVPVTIANQQVRPARRPKTPRIVRTVVAPPVPQAAGPIAPVVAPEMAAMPYDAATQAGAPAVMRSTLAMRSQHIPLTSFRLPMIRGLSAGLGPSLRTSGGAHMNVRQRLMCPRRVQEAIVLREILGPPRAMSPNPGA